MLKNNKLLIDENCPMCNIYGYCFTKGGLIDQETVDSYQGIEEAYAKKIDMERARNEIALHDIEANTTVYGIDAMIKIVAEDRPWLMRLLHTRFVYRFLTILYRFISYNRKVIYPTQQEPGMRVCIPDTNTKYRWAYLIFVALFTGVVLNLYAYHFNMGMGIEHDWTREYYICFGQVFWQMIAIGLLHKSKALEYLGNMSTVSMIGGLLLLPILAINHYITLSPLTLFVLFGSIVSFMFFEHIRRCKLLGVSLWMTVSWVMFRMFVLIIILTFMVLITL